MLSRAFQCAPRLVRPLGVLRRRALAVPGVSATRSQTHSNHVSLPFASSLRTVRFSTDAATGLNMTSIPLRDVPQTQAKWTTIGRWMGGVAGVHACVCVWWCACVRVCV